MYHVHPCATLILPRGSRFSLHFMLIGASLPSATFLAYFVSMIWWRERFWHMDHDTSISCIPNVCSYFVKLYCSSLDWFIARKICFFHFLPMFQDFNFEPSNTEVTLWNLSCFTFMILGFISSRWLQSSLKKGHPFAKQAVNLARHHPVGSSLQVEEVRPTLSAFNGQLTPKRQALLQRKEKFACQCLGCRVCHIQTGWMIFILRGHYWWISP